MLDNLKEEYLKEEIVLIKCMNYINLKLKRNREIDFNFKEINEINNKIQNIKRSFKNNFMAPM